MILHDPSVRDAIKARVKAIPPNAKAKWGSMNVGQMVWHLNAGIETALGTLKVGDEKAPLPAPIMRFMVLYLPWPKNSPTAGVMKATEPRDLETERAKLLSLIDSFVARPIHGKWPVHPVMGAMSGQDYSRLHARHLNYHLGQFGA